ncbi:T9SS type A sorting domain-containing protein [Bacteroidia bacterium]|nr:T9SS type A sorting domain-containing protein [Bacteroidia bacterium]
MRKINTTLLIILMLSGFGLNGQTITQGNVISTYCPQYMASGVSTRMATYFSALIAGLNSGETYYYTVSACAASDINTAYGGAGGSLYLHADSPTRYVSAPDFTAGNFDSFTITSSLESKWFGFVNSTDTRFSAGKYVYPLISIKSATSPFSVRFALNDSIKVLAFSSSAGANNGTGLYGTSKGSSKEMVLVYDTNKSTANPLTIARIEGDELKSSDYSSASFYTNNVDGEVGAWGNILPNTLAKGIRRIDRRSFATSAIIHTQLDTNGVWLSVNTKDPRGGSSSPVILTEDEAALVPTKVEFSSTFVNVGEGADSFKSIVRRQFATEDTAMITVELIGGTATNVLDFNITGSKTFKFAPGKEFVDTFTFAIVDDNLTEGSEVITLKIKNPINTTRGKDSTQSITIVDNDTPSITFVNPVIVTREGLPNVFGQIAIAKGTTGTTTCEAHIKSKSPLTTIPNEFYLSANTTNDTLVSFSNSVAADTFDLYGFVVDESFIDAPDTIIIVLRNPSGSAVIGADSTLMFIIKDDDAPPGVRFVTLNQTVSETSGSIDVQIELLNRNNNPSDFSLKYMDTRSDVTEGADFTFNPTSKIYSFGTSGSDTITVTVPLLNDTDFEADEMLVFAVEGTVNCINYLPDTLRITLTSDDKEKVSIANASATNLSTGVALRLNDELSISGVTHGFNRKSAGNEFTLIDATGGMQVFTISDQFGYTFAEGDSLTVIGRINQSNGVTQMTSLDTIIKYKSNADLTSANTINKLSELSEQEHIRLANVRFYDVTTWPSSALSSDQEALVYAKNSLGDTITIRIDAEGPIDGSTSPDVNKYYNISGIGSQNDPTSPFTSGYLIIPSSISDIQLVNSPTIRFSNPSISVPEDNDSTGEIVVSFANFGFQNVGFSVINTNTGTAFKPKEYNFNDININVLPSVSSFNFRIDLTGDNDEDGDRTIILALRKPKYGVLIGADSILTITLVDDETSVNSLDKIGVKLYPNPSSDRLKLTSKHVIQKASIYNLQGALVLETSEIKNNEINIQVFKQGLYHIVLEIDGELFSATFQKN